MSVREAIMTANRTRLRPILMTTVMLVAAMIPMAMGEGPGTAGRAGMAKVILGGQVLSLLLTLLVTPVAYSIWEDLIAWSGRLARQMEPTKIALAGGDSARGWSSVTARTKAQASDPSGESASSLRWYLTYLGDRGTRRRPWDTSPTCPDNGQIGDVSHGPLVRSLGSG